MKNGDKPVNYIAGGDEGWLRNNSYILTGLTKREYFAAMALQGLLSNEKIIAYANYDSFIPAEAAVLHADQLLNQLEKTTNEKSI